MVYHFQNKVLNFRPIILTYSKKLFNLIISRDELKDYIFNTITFKDLIVLVSSTVPDTFSLTSVGYLFNVDRSNVKRQRELFLAKKMPIGRHKSFSGNTIQEIKNILEAKNKEKQLP